jgi:hypothetical protein
MDPDRERVSISPVDETLNWIARERDAVWTAKLVILRVAKVDDIVHFGVCLREHERHIGELFQVACAFGVALERAPLAEPSFVTREPHVIGALADSELVLNAMERIEAARNLRYATHRALDNEPSHHVLARVLARHRCDASARLEWLHRRLGRVRSAGNVAA